MTDEFRDAIARRVKADFAKAKRAELEQQARRYRYDE